MLITPSLSLGTDIRAVKTMPELQTNNETSNSSSTSNIRRSDQEHQQYVRSVINKISSIYDQSQLKCFIELNFICRPVFRFAIALVKDS